MAILHKNISAEGDIHNPKWFSGANNGDVAWRNELGVLESTDELVLPAALDFVDGSAAPPTSNSGDIYVLSSGASVNAGWGTVALGDWVRYDGTTWNDITPQKSTLCYDEDSDTLHSYDGTTWVAIGGASIYTADDTIGAGRVATLTDSLTFKDGTVNIQGIGISGSSALAIYDNDTTPNKLWDFLDNGNVNLGGDSTVDLGSNDLSFENGETTLKSSSNFPLIVQNTQSATLGGQGALKILSNVSASAVGSGAIIDVVSNGTLNTGRIHNYTFSNGDVGWRIYSWGGSGAIGNSYLAQNESTALIGENATSKIGSETISLQGDTLVHSSASFPLTVQNTQSATAGGQGALKILSNVASGAVGSGAIIDVVSNGSLNTGRIHNYTFGSGNVGWRIYSWGGSSSLGNSYLAQDKNAALIGKNVTSRVSTEDISLQGSTVIKGLGTSGSSALAIYDNDTTPVKVFEVLDDSTIKTNGNSGFTGTGAYTNFTIENGIITNAT